MNNALARVLLSFASCVASAQQPPPGFAAATVKVNNSMSEAMGGYIGIPKGGRIGMRNVTLNKLIELAYGVEEYRVSSGASWITASRYDVEAKPASPVDAAQARFMLQTLLADRFGLRVHHQTTSVQGYRLVVEKGRSKLRKSDEEGWGFRVVSMEEILGPADMTGFVRALTGVLGSPVEDDTGLAGKYDIELKWKPAATAGDGVASDPGSTIFGALKEQLGLALKAGKVSVDMIVIDHAEREPVEN